MKLKYFLIIGLITLTFSCGKSQQEIEQEKAQIALEQKTLAEQKEKERIHLEKIEIGKFKLEKNLTDELDRLKNVLTKERNNLSDISKFKLGRSSSTKKKQLAEQEKKVTYLSEYIGNLEKEIALINLRETFDFQNTPEGVVNHIFQSIKNRDFSKLRNLCDPYAENDGDSRGICLTEMQPLDIRNQFVESFENARIIGQSKVENDRAKVEIIFGKNSNQVEKINLIKRMDKWYIISL